MSFLDRYEFEQILDEDLALSHNQWQPETAKAPPTRLASTSKSNMRIWRTVLMGLTAAGLGFSLFHQPNFAQHPQMKRDYVALIQQK